MAERLSGERPYGGWALLLPPLRVDQRVAPWSRSGVRREVHLLTSRRPNATYLVDARNGAILRTLDPGFDFPQAAFADGWLYTASSTGLYAWGP